MSSLCASTHSVVLPLSQRRKKSESKAARELLRELALFEVHAEHAGPCTGLFTHGSLPLNSQFSHQSLEGAI